MVIYTGRKVSFNLGLLCSKNVCSCFPVFCLLCIVCQLQSMCQQAFEAKNDPLGVTLIGDLAEVDMPKIQSLALIELTALFDLYDITYSRPKRKKKPRGEIDEDDDDSSQWL